MGVVSVVISCMDDLDICPGNFGLFGEFLADEIFGYFQIAVEQPAYQAYCKHIAAFQHGLVVHSGVGKAVFHHLRDGGGDDILLNTHFLYRIIGLESGLSKSDFWKASVSMMIQAVDLANLYWVFSAAAFIATNTSHLSPGV